MGNTVSRIKQYIDYKSISIRRFEESLGFSNGSFASQYKNNKTIGVDKVESILQQYAEINPEWLLTGKGEMIKSSMLDATEPLIATPDVVEVSAAYQRSAPITTSFPSLTDVTVNNQRIPLYNIDAAAGLVSLFNETPNHILDYISIPNLPKVDSAVYIRGDSMYPILKSGDIILVKQIHNIDYILFGEMHLLSFSADDDEYICVKFVQRSDDKNYVKLVSQNTHHPDQLIPINSIRAIAIVKASIRYNTMG